MPGIGELMEGAMQQAPQPARQGIDSSAAGLLMSGTSHASERGGQRWQNAGRPVRRAGLNKVFGDISLRSTGNFGVQSPDETADNLPVVPSFLSHPFAHAGRCGFDERAFFLQVPPA